MDEAFTALAEASAASAIVSKAIIYALARQTGIDRKMLELDLLHAIQHFEGESNSPVVQSVLLSVANDIPKLVREDN